jgi:hypothetical protein
MVPAPDTRTPADPPPGFRLGVVRGISYGLWGKPDQFVPQARALGAGLIRASVYWSQVEPEPGRYVWDVVDALLDQCDDHAELWLTVCSSSLWATRQATDFQPQSPAHDLDAYGAFVRRLVRHCGRRVTYWQCNNEPSNTTLWAGTAAEYVTQLRAMHTAVKEVDPTARVVLGGCGYDVFSSSEGSVARQFFDQIVSTGRDSFDLFAANLYGDPADIPRHLDTAERMMRDHGYRRPIVVGEYGGPVLFEFPELEAVIQDTFIRAFSEQPAVQSTEELAKRAGQDTPERRAMVALYDRRPSLPPRLQMLMAGCAPELEAKRHRISCRQLVMRNLLAFAAGVRRTAYWNLAPEIPDYEDPYQMVHLMFGKLHLLGYQGQTLGHRHPAADTFALLARELAGTEAVTRLDGSQPATLYAFRVDRAGREPLLVLWDRRDPFAGEDEPPVDMTWPWDAPAASAVDAFGNAHPVRVDDGRLHLAVSATPVFITPASVTSAFVTPAEVGRT